MTLEEMREAWNSSHLFEVVCSIQYREERVIGRPRSYDEAERIAAELDKRAKAVNPSDWTRRHYWHRLHVPKPPDPQLTFTNLH